MGLVESLLEQGNVLPGMQPKGITSPGSTPAWGVDTSQLGGALRSIQEQDLKAKMDEQERMKKEKDQSDMYKTLRDAGYSPSQAHDAVISGNYPSGIANSDSLSTQKEKAQIDEIKSSTTKNNAAADLYNRKQGVNEGSKSQLEADIMGRILDGTATEEDTKIYNDVIKKKSQGGLAEVLSTIEKTNSKSASAPAAPAKVGDADPQIPVTSPDGKVGYVRQSKLEAALKKGFKKRQ